MFQILEAMYQYMIYGIYVHKVILLFEYLVIYLLNKLNNLQVVILISYMEYIN